MLFFFFDETDYMLPFAVAYSILWSTLQINNCRSYLKTTLARYIAIPGESLAEREKGR